MNEEGFKRYFRSERMPNWACPECGSLSLTLVDDTFNAKYKSPIDTSHAEFDPDWIEYVFTMHLECSVGSCKHRVVCIGDGSVSQEYTHDGEGSWDWFEQYQVKHFEPPLKIFIPPKETPHWVRHALDISFSTYFSSPGTSLSELRSALEVLISELGVTSVDENGKYLSLAKKISLLPDKYRKIIEPANAIRWLGNDGTHSGVMVRDSDVLDGYKIFNHILIELYPDKDASVETLVSKINKAKGIDRGA